MPGCCCCCCCYCCSVQYCQTRVFEGIGFFDLKGALIPIPRARPRSTADSRRAIPLCYSRAACSNLPLKNRRYPAITFSGHRKSETHTHTHTHTHTRTHTDHGSNNGRDTRFSSAIVSGRAFRPDIQPRLALRCKIPSEGCSRNCQIGLSSLL